MEQPSPSLFLQASTWFWNPSIWLLPNVTWSDLKSPENPQNDPDHPLIRYPQLSALWNVIPVTALIIILRLLCEKFVFRRLGLHLGLKPLRRVPTNNVLEEAFQLVAAKKMPKINSQEMADKLGVPQRQVDYWIKRRKAQGKPGTLDKFCETGWRWTYYSCIFLYGVFCLWNEPWVKDINFCWYHYPHHSVSIYVQVYYIVEIAFYASLTFSQFTDVRRKDFIEMFIHHLLAIALMVFSWTCNLTRVGSLVLVLHDFADIWLELAKLAKYAKFDKICEIVYGFFTMSWFVSRLGIYPSWILYSTTVEAPQIIELWPAYHIFNVMLYLLMVLHVIWTYFILKVAYNAIYATPGKMADTRSDSEQTPSSLSDFDKGNQSDGA